MASSPAEPPLGVAPSYVWEAYGAAALCAGALIAVGPGHRWVTLAILTVIVAALALSDRQVPLLFYLLVGVGGLLFEALIIRTRGSWSYRSRDLFGAVPLWLAPGWALAGGAILASYVLGADLTSRLRKN